MPNWFSRLFLRRQLPDEALDHLRAVLAAYDRLRADSPTGNYAGEDAQIEDIKTRLDAHPETLWWTDIGQADLCALPLLKEDELRARLNGWRRRFREVAGEARYSQYVASLPPQQINVPPDESLRADLSECMRSVYYFYAAYGLSARSRSSVTVWLFRVAFLVIVIEVILGYAFSRMGPLATEIVKYALGTAFFAVLGSVVSVQRRLQDPTIVVDPFYQYIQTSADWFGIAVVSPVFSAIFGLLTYGLLLSDLVSTKLITFSDPLQLHANVTPHAAADAAVLFILGFAAGFAEQLIPDAITRIASRALSVGPTTPAPPPPPSPKDLG
jgi:hypothetical protein